MKKIYLAAGKAALYDPYLDTLGGGEKYILSILQVLSEKGFEITVFWSDKSIAKKIKETFALQFNIKLEPWPQTAPKILWALKTFDYFFYVTDGSYFFPSARRNFIYAMVPQKNLYQMNLLNRLKTSNYKFICHSNFTQSHLEKWGIKASMIYPYIDQPVNQTPKQKIILTVGRFFKHLHSKRQDLAIKYFLKLQTDPQFADYKLILAGGLKKEDQGYFDELVNLAGNNSSIIFKPNVSFNELSNLYHSASFFWHFAGFGIDEQESPQLVEHMGITPLEAMSYGVIPFCYQAGGPAEVIDDGINGFLFKTGNELLDKMKKVANDINLQDKIRTNAIEFIKDNFSYEVFKEKVIDTLNIS